MAKRSGSNSALNSARKAKNDEFFTHYKPEGTSYKIEVKNNDTADKIEETIKHGYDFNSEINRKALQSLGVITPLQETGDFRSPECIELLKKSDIVITNPPFSLFREYVAQLMEYKKVC